MGQIVLKIFLSDIPELAELKSRQFAPACHALDFLGAAAELRGNFVDTKYPPETGCRFHSTPLPICPCAWHRFRSKLAILHFYRETPAPEPGRHPIRNSKLRQSFQSA